MLITAIHEAVLAELVDVGYAGLTMEGVADRAGAGKASLYRRWNSRAELVRDTAFHLMPEPERLPDTGNLRDDLRELLSRTVELLSGPLGQALRAVLAEAIADRPRNLEPRSLSTGMGRRMMRTVVQRAVQRGELSEAAVADIRLDVGLALMRDRLLFRGDPIDAGLVDEIVDQVLIPLYRTPA